MPHVTIRIVQSRVVTRGRQIAKSGETWGEKLGLIMSSKTRPRLGELVPLLKLAAETIHCMDG